MACSDEPYSAPTCRIAKSEANNISALEHNSQAACLVKISGRLLIVERSSGLYDLAYSKNIAETYHEDNNDSSKDTQRISAQCAAHQAMWLQTGFNVEVGSLLTTQRNGTKLYACDMQAGFDGSERYIDAPPWRPTGVKKMQFVYPFDIELKQWQHPEHFTAMRDAFVLAPDISPIHLINTSD